MNELYLKVTDITDHSIALDVDFLLDQALNIEVIGCTGEKIKYVVNDKDYMLGNTILQFFFNTEITNKTMNLPFIYFNIVISNNFHIFHGYSAVLRNISYFSDSTVVCV